MQNNKTHCKKHFTTEGMPSIIAKKVSGLVNVLNSDYVNVKQLKAFLGQGIPDEAAILRQYCWKIILGFIPEEKDLWETKIQKQVKTYEEFVKQFLPQQKFPQYPIILNKHHPRWSQLEEDFLLWQQIQKDTSRTHAQLSFFSTPAPQIMIPYLTSPRRQKFRLIHGQDQGQYKAFLGDKQKQRKSYRYDYMTRILYIYAKLNPRIQYVQGMNEILAPIFYIVNSSKPPNSPVDEASCFFMFNNAISDIIQLHIKDLDKSQNGIYGKLNQVNRMLVVIQPRIWSRLQKLKIDPFYYCFRWMTLLFAQDFALFDVLRIWESIFSAQNRLDFMNYFAIAMIITAKQFILNNDFVQVLSYLQNIGQTMDLGSALLVASQLYFEFKGHDFMAHSEMTKKALKKKQQDKDKKNTIGGGFAKISKFIKNIL